MFDDLECLRSQPLLLQLFYYYARLGAPDRDSWLIRVGQMEGAETAELTRLHGELIGLDWIEQNTGQMPCCYRITLAGLRAFRQLESPEEEVSNQAA